MPRAPLPPLNPDERILLTRETEFKKRHLWLLLVVVPVSRLLGFVTLRIVGAVRGFGLPPLADALFSGALVLIAVMVSVPLDWLMQRGRVWAVTNQRIIDNKGLDLQGSGPAHRAHRPGVAPGRDLLQDHHPLLPCRASNRPICAPFCCRFWAPWSNSYPQFCPKGCRIPRPAGAPRSGRPACDPVKSCCARGKSARFCPACWP